MAKAMADSPYIQAEVDCNAAVVNIGRPAAINQELLRDRMK